MPGRPWRCSGASGTVVAPPMRPRSTRCCSLLRGGIRVFVQRYYRSARSLPVLATWGVCIAADTPATGLQCFGRKHCELDSAVLHRRTRERSVQGNVAVTDWVASGGHVNFGPAFPMSKFSPCIYTAPNFCCASVQRVDLGVGHEYSPARYTHSMKP